MRLTVLGCAGSSYDAKRALPCSSYLLESSKSVTLLDCGFGSFESFATLRPEVRLDAIIVSHAHDDHVADLETFLNTPSVWRKVPRLVASRPTIDALAFDLTTISGVSLDRVGDGDRVTGNGFEAEFSSTRHQIPTLGVQVTMDGSRVVYSADTGPGWVFPATFRAADLAIVECTFEERDDSSSPYHLDAREVAEIVNGLSPLATLVAHVPPDESGERRRKLVEQRAREEQIILAFPGLSLETGRHSSL